MSIFTYRALPLHYQVYGKGESVLLIHGLGCSGADWALQIPALSALFKVIVPDLPGCGMSPPPKCGYSIAGSASLLWGLLDEMKVKHPSVVGFSMGGAIALEMTLQCPTQVSHLALINSLASYHDNWRKWIYARASGALVRLLGMRQAANIFATGLFPEPWQRPFRDRAAAEVATIPASDYLEMSDALEQWAATEQLNQIKSRILLIAGEHDHTPLSEKLFPRRKAAREHCSGSRLASTGPHGCQRGDKCLH